MDLGNLLSGNEAIGATIIAAVVTFAINAGIELTRFLVKRSANKLDDTLLELVETGVKKALSGMLVVNTDAKVTVEPPKPAPAVIETTTTSVETPVKEQIR